MTRSTLMNKVPQQKAGRVAFERLGAAMLGLVLIAAGSLKLLSFLADARDETLATLIFAFFAEVELIVGLWFLIDSRPGATLPWAVATSAGLVVASLYQILAGYCICNRFGDRDISPWLALTLDLAALAALTRGRMSLVISDASQSRLVPAIVVLVVGLLSAREAGLVTIVGTASFGNRPLDNVTLTFVGNYGPISVRTAQDGRFRLPSVRPGMYFVSTPAKSLNSSLSHLKSGMSDGKIEPIPGGWQRATLSSPAKSIDPSASLNISDCGGGHDDIVLKDR